MSEHDFEPIRGLPGDLPKGERLLWQGAPSWTRLACQAFHVRAVSAYFGLMLAARTIGAVAAGQPLDRALATSLSVAPVALLGVALLTAFAWLNARTTVYTVTSRRIVMRFGIALPKAINLPFSIVESGALKAFGDGSGDVAITLKAPNKMAFLHLWPHVRPWKVAAPQPTFRAIPDAASVATLLALAMKAEVGAAIAPVPAVLTPVAAPDRAGVMGGRVHPEAATA